MAIVIIRKKIDTFHEITQNGGYSFRHLSTPLP